MPGDTGHQWDRRPRVPAARWTAPVRIDLDGAGVGGARPTLVHAPHVGEELLECFVRLVDASADETVGFAARWGERMSMRTVGNAITTKSKQRTSETAPGEPRAGWERSAGSANPEFEGRKARTTLYLRSARPGDGSGWTRRHRPARRPGDGAGLPDNERVANSATSLATSRRSSGWRARPPRPGIGPPPRREMPSA